MTLRILPNLHNVPRLNLFLSRRAPAVKTENVFLAVIVDMLSNTLTPSFLVSSTGAKLR